MTKEKENLLEKTRLYVSGGPPILKWASLALL